MVCLMIFWSTTIPKELELVWYWLRQHHGIKDLNVFQERPVSIHSSMLKAGKRLLMQFMQKNLNYFCKSFMEAGRAWRKPPEDFTLSDLHKLRFATIIADLTFHMKYLILWPCKILNKLNKISEKASNWQNSAISMEYNYTVHTGT